MPLGKGDTNVFCHLSDSDTRSKSSSKLLNREINFVAKLEFRTLVNPEKQ